MSRGHGPSSGSAPSPSAVQVGPSGTRYLPDQKPSFKLKHCSSSLIQIEHHNIHDYDYEERNLGEEFRCVYVRRPNKSYNVCPKSGGTGVPIFTATCFSNVAVMPSLDVRLSVRPSVCDVGEH